MDKYKNLPLRDSVGIILLNKENKVFVGKRIDNPNNFWQMPQGGIDKGEKNFNAAIRELEEETGIKSVKLIKEIENCLEYELPENLINKIWQGRYKGQKQKWFVMRFLGKEDEICIKTKKPEFLEWKWISVEKLPDIVVDFKVNVYKKLVKELKSINI